MRVLKSIARSRIPSHSHGDGNRSNSKFYDKVAVKSRAMDLTRALPIVCHNPDECVRLMSALRTRKVKCLRRGLTVYTLNERG